jgi:hypothetical protein
MAVLWILLFAGRWIAVPFLEYAGVVTQQQMAALDQGILLRLYLVLFCITILVIALRAVRSGSGAQAGSSASEGNSRAGKGNEERGSRD